MPDPSQVSCPHCGQPYAMRPEQWDQYNGRTINCTKCGRAFMVTIPRPASNDAAWPGTAPAGPTPGGMQPSGSPALSCAPPPPSYAGFPPGYPAPPPGYGPGTYGPPRARTSGWAITSLVIGIMGLCVPVIGGVIAIVAGILGIVRTSRGRFSGRGMAIAGLVLGIIGLLVATPLEIAFAYGMRVAVAEGVHRAACVQNMRELGRGLLDYASAHHGRFPDTLGQVMQNADPPTLSAFVCPDDDKTPPTGNSPKAIEASINDGRHCSYIYKGKGLTDTADAVILYEPMANHSHMGMHVLYADGVVKWLQGDAAQAVLRQMTRPATRPSSEPATEPASEEAAKAASRPADDETASPGRSSSGN